MTKWHFFGIGGLAILLLVLFGKNPSDSLHQKMLDHMNRSLVAKIMDHNGIDTKHQKPPRFRDSVNQGVDTSADKEATSPLQEYRRVPQAGTTFSSRGAGNALPAFQTGNVSSPGMMPVRRGSMQMQPSPAAQQQPQPVPASSDDYYPPAPSRGGYTGPQSSLDTFIASDGTEVTKDKRIVVQGTRVFLVGSDGVQAPMKDGKYLTADGSYMLIIKGGQRTVF